MKAYYHITSAALKSKMIFENDRDFVIGVNEVALCVLKFDVKVLAFCLMTNHFHFVVYGQEQDCVAFVQEYKRMLSIRMRNAKQEVGILRKVDLHVDELVGMDYLQNAIAYVLRNPMAARLKVMPYCYRWSSAGVYFRGGNHLGGIRLNDLSFRKRIAVLKSRCEVPNEYMIDEDGMILPSCFVDYASVEQIFRYPAVLMSALSRKIETEFELQSGIADRVSVTDSDLMTQVNKLIWAEFGVLDVVQLSKEDRIRLCRLVRRNFGVSAKQIARVLRISPDIVDAVI